MYVWVGGWLAQATPRRPYSQAPATARPRTGVDVEGAGGEVHPSDGLAENLGAKAQALRPELVADLAALPREATGRYSETDSNERAAVKAAGSAPRTRRILPPCGGGDRCMELPRGPPTCSAHLETQAQQQKQQPTALLSEQQAARLLQGSSPIPSSVSAPGCPRGSPGSSPPRGWWSAGRPPQCHWPSSPPASPAAAPRARHRWRRYAPRGRCR